MKPVILAVLFLLLLSQNEALRCNCGGKRQCSSRIETCSGSNDVCVSAIFPGPVYGYFKGCYKANDCALLSQLGSIAASCCNKDLCN